MNPIFRSLTLLLFCVSVFIKISSAQQNTYCNPINIDYGYTPIPNFSEWGRHRATADPVIVQYKGSYFLFSTNQWGYWWSDDMLKWNFISKNRNKVGGKYRVVYVKATPGNISK